ncbi:MAG TPA: hypothetical protein VM096_08280 [Vicinamibacterales bacterium]|nr:hypothetical protein [Vicinamibacterales bacterium]
MVQDFRLRALRQPDTICKPASIARESFGDIARTGTDRVAQLLNPPVMALEVGRQQEQIDAQVEQVRELPGRDIAEIGGSRHGAARCNRAADGVPEHSGVFRSRSPAHVEES